MAELKTKKTRASVEKFLDGIDDKTKREDCYRIVELMKKETKSEPAMWGPSIVGFGNWHYKYATGREADWFLAGFSPRKDSLTLYLMSGLERHAALLKKLGKHKIGKGCLYIKKLDDVDTATLRELIKRSIAQAQASMK